MTDPRRTASSWFTTPGKDTMLRDMASQEDLAQGPPRPFVLTADYGSTYTVVNMNGEEFFLLDDDVLEIKYSADHSIYVTRNRQPSEYAVRRDILAKLPRWLRWLVDRNG